MPFISKHFPGFCDRMYHIPNLTQYFFWLDGLWILVTVYFFITYCILCRIKGIDSIFL